MASLDKVTISKGTYRFGAIESTTDPYVFGASGEIVAAVATRAQLVSKTVTPTVGEARNIGCTRKKGLPNDIGQA